MDLWQKVGVLKALYPGGVAPESYEELLGQTMPWLEKLDHLRGQKEKIPPLVPVSAEAEDVPTILQAYASPMTLKQISKRLGWSHSRTHGDLRRLLRAKRIARVKAHREPGQGAAPYLYSLA